MYQSEWRITQKGKGPFSIFYFLSSIFYLLFAIDCFSSIANEK